MHPIGSGNIRDHLDWSDCLQALLASLILFPVSSDKENHIWAETGSFVVPRPLRCVPREKRLVVA